MTGKICGMAANNCWVGLNAFRVPDITESPYKSQEKGKVIFTIERVIFSVCKMHFLMRYR